MHVESARATDLVRYHEPGRCALRDRQPDLDHACTPLDGLSNSSHRAFMLTWGARERDPGVQRPSRIPKWRSPFREVSSRFEWPTANQFTPGLPPKLCIACSRIRDLYLIEKSEFSPFRLEELTIIVNYP